MQEFIDFISFMMVHMFFVFALGSVAGAAAGWFLWKSIMGWVDSLDDEEDR